MDTNLHHCGNLSQIALVCSRFVGNKIKFENETYMAEESVGNFTEVRLVVDQPFAEDTSVIISYENISATGQCSTIHTIISIMVTL